MEQVFEQINKIKKEQKIIQRNKVEKLSIIVDQLYNNAEKTTNDQRMGTMLQRSTIPKGQEHYSSNDEQSFSQ